MNPHDKPEPSPIAPGELPLVSAPPDLWARIDARTLGSAGEPERQWFRWQWGAALAVAAVLAFVLWPRDAWVESGRIELSEIGYVDVHPGSRVRISVQKADEIRLVLAHGQIEATVTAPPRLFLVETPSTLAVDLGCAYRMNTDEDGNGQLEVTSGWVALEREGRESLVPAGANCKMRGSRYGTARGPGTPYFADAPEPLVRALDSFDTQGGELDTVLGLARPRDTLTLWHLLRRVEGDDRERVFDRIAALAPLPDGVTREKALALDQEALARWREDLAWVW